MMYAPNLQTIGPRINRSEQMVRRIQILHDRLMFGGSVHDEKPLVHQNSPIAGISPAIANTAVLDSASSQSNGSPQPIKDYKNMTASQIAKDYITACLMECSIHGLNHVAAPDRTKAERSMWLVFVILALCGAVWLSLSIKQHYDESPTAISVEVNNMDWYTLYPAGTMCPHERVDDTELEKYITENLKNVQDKESLKEFVRNLANATYDNFLEFKDVSNNPIKSEDYLELLYAVRKKPKFQHFNTESQNVLLVETVTERGLCYTYNNKAAIYNEPMYWMKNNWTVWQGAHLTLLVHPVMKSVTASFNNVEETNISFYFHSPLDVMDMSDFGYFVGDGSLTSLDLLAMATITTPEAKELSVTQRKCRFPEENFLKISPIYTINLCKAECRMRLAQKECGCIPYFYRRVDNVKVCDVNGMHCLGQKAEMYKTLINPKTNKKIECNCVSMCNDVTYYVDQLRDFKSPLETSGLSVQWRMIEYPKMRVKRDVIFGLTDLWVSVGGTGGLFLGCSVLSIIEIFYFLTLRLYVYLYRIHVEKKKAQNPKGRQNVLFNRMKM